MMTDGRLLLTSLEAAYLRMFGTAIQPAVYGYQSVIALLTSISSTVLIKGRPPKRYIVLNRDLASEFLNITLVYLLKIRKKQKSIISFHFIFFVEVMINNDVLLKLFDFLCPKNT